MDITTCPGICDDYLCYDCVGSIHKVWNTFGIRDANYEETDRCFEYGTCYRCRFVSLRDAYEFKAEVGSFYADGNDHYVDLYPTHFGTKFQ